MASHPYFLHSHGEIQKETSHFPIVVLKLENASASLRKLVKSGIAGPIHRASDLGNLR